MLEKVAAKARKENRYIMLSWWQLFFERPWGLRGMQNLMIDYYTERDNVLRLHEALCEVYCKYVRVACDILKPDALFTSDDLDHQTGPMMSPDIFRELIYPYYKRLGDTLKDCKMHFWLHSCGDNVLLLDDLINAGLDVYCCGQWHCFRYAD